MDTCGQGCKGTCKDACTGTCWGECANNCWGKCATSCSSTAFAQDTSGPVPKPFKTGGYTGSWGSEGKLAILHEKELVLNKEDTENLLASIQMVRDYIHSIDFNTAGMLALNPYAAATIASQGSQLEQNVTIEASFPSVKDRNEIEEALKSLVNRASQYINK